MLLGRGRGKNYFIFLLLFPQMPRLVSLSVGVADQQTDSSQQSKFFLKYYTIVIVIKGMKRQSCCRRAFERKLELNTFEMKEELRALALPLSVYSGRISEYDSFIPYPHVLLKKTRYVCRRRREVA